MKEKICLAIFYVCMVVAALTLGYASYMLFAVYFTGGDVGGVASGAKELLGGFFFGAGCIGVIWCFVGMVRA